MFAFQNELESKTFLTAGNLTCHSRNSTGGANDINDGSVPLQHNAAINSDIIHAPVLKESKCPLCKRSNELVSFARHFPFGHVFTKQPLT